MSLLKRGASPYHKLVTGSPHACIINAYILSRYEEYLLRVCGRGIYFFVLIFALLSLYAV